MTVQTDYEHIVLEDGRVAVIDGTRTKVVELVADHQAHGWSPEEMHFQHPHLTLGQIHSALAYYWDHRDEFERELRERLAHTDRLRSEASPSPLQSHLKNA